MRVIEFDDAWENKIYPYNIVMMQEKTITNSYNIIMKAIQSIECYVIENKKKIVYSKNKYCASEISMRNVGVTSVRLSVSTIKFLLIRP